MFIHEHVALNTLNFLSKVLKLDLNAENIDIPGFEMRASIPCRYI